MTLGAGLPSTKLESPFYRARAGMVSQVIGEFDAPPARVVKEGRYNHAGNPVIYLASDAETCIEEMRRSACAIAEISLSSPLRILDLNTPSSSHPDSADQISVLTYSALMSAKQPDEGWHKPAYVFSRFIADCARAAGIQAIRYPSTRITSNASFNLVIVDPTIRLAQHATVGGFQSFSPTP